jgi:hypothetical protein
MHNKEDMIYLCQKKGLSVYEFAVPFDNPFLDALPMTELSRTIKDKRVSVVLGDPKRQNSRNERLIVNSLGEGAIWVCNSNGNIENRDY